MTNLNINRRNFLKAAGVTSAVGAAAAATAVAAPTIAKAEYNQPAGTLTNMAIKYLEVGDAPYNYYPYEGIEEYEQALMTAPQSDQNFIDQYLDGVAVKTVTSANKLALLSAGTAGYSLRDTALSAGANIGNGADIFTEKNTDFTSTSIQAVGKWEDTEDNNALTVKKAGYFYGAGAVGICEMNEKFMYGSADAPVTFVDGITEPSGTAKTGLQLPTAMKYAIIILAPMDGNIAQFTPRSLGGAAASQGYAKIYELTGRVATFIRNLGYVAVPDISTYGLNIAMAIDAGLGELGRHGLLINPEYGSNFKLGKVVTDFPMTVDNPITFGAAEFCITCKKCAEACPSKSISMEDLPSYDVQCDSNHPGMKKWYVNTWTCKEQEVISANACHVCARACTYTKQPTWVHDVIKLTASKTTAFNSIFATMDDAFGYGLTWGDDNNFTQADVDEWWSGDARNLNWTREY